MHQDKLLIFLFITEIKISNSNVRFLQTEAATITCILSNILETTTITWNYGVTGVTTTGGKYTINAPPYNLEAKTVTSEMEITAAQLAILAATSAQPFTCSADVATTDVAITSTAVFLQIFSKWKTVAARGCGWKVFGRFARTCGFKAVPPTAGGPRCRRNLAILDP